MTGAAGTNTRRTSDAGRPYHHGELAAALLDAAGKELAEKGIEGFSLRGVAKRAGVSHAAPAHHFRDADGLLTALAARGFELFVARQEAFRRKARPAPREQLVASGLGYLAFAIENPALFRLMFGSRRPDFADGNLSRAAAAAFDNLVVQVARVTGKRGPPGRDRSALIDVSAAWALAHGLADLVVAGRLPYLTDLPEAARERAIAAIIRRALPP